MDQLWLTIHPALGFGSVFVIFSVGFSLLQ